MTETRPLHFVTTGFQSALHSSAIMAAMYRYVLNVKRVAYHAYQLESKQREVLSAAAPPTATKARCRRVPP
jgi:hypothetical protein